MPGKKNAILNKFRASNGIFHPSASVAMGPVLAITCASTVHAQWTVTNLHPLGSDSQAAACGIGQQAGFTKLGTNYHAGLWNGASTSWVDIHPSGWTESFAFATDGVQTTGYVGGFGTSSASVWSGSAETWVNLSPPGAGWSYAYGVGGGQQVGQTYFNGIYRASLWQGTAASWIDLNPAGSLQSRADAVNAGWQVGSANTSGGTHASLWSGSAASWIDLHPTLANESYAIAVFGNRQGGAAVINGVWRACVWSGSAASWLDINPANSTYSVVLGMCDGFEAGLARFEGRNHAGVWSGSPYSWVDLHTLVPARFSSSVAQGISTEGPRVYVVGHATTPAGNTEAMLWTICRTPAITLHPISQVVCPTGSTSLSTPAAAFSPTTYQWQWQFPGDPNWLPITNGVNSLATAPQFEALGSTTFRVTIRPPVGPGGNRIWPNSGYRFRAVVSNTCGSVTSDEATLTVCAADFDCDGDITFFDYLDFVDAFSFQSTTSDFNHDGGIDFFDYLDFADAFSIGC